MIHKNPFCKIIKRHISCLRRMFTILWTKYDVVNFAEIKLHVAVTIILCNTTRCFDNWYCVKIINAVSWKRWLQNKFQKRFRIFFFLKSCPFNLRDFLELNFVLQIWANKFVIRQKIVGMGVTLKFIQILYNIVY